MELMEIANWIAVFVIAALSGMGVGSAGLYVVYLTAVLGVDQLAAQGQNLIFFMIASGASLLYHLPRRNMRPSVLSVVMLLGVCGALLGSRLAAVLPREMIQKLFGAMLVISGGLVFLRRDRKDRKKDKKLP